MYVLWYRIMVNVCNRKVAHNKVLKCMVYTHFYLTVNTASFTVYDGSCEDRKEVTSKVADLAFGINETQKYKDVQPKIERFIEQQVNLMYLSSNLLRGITVFSFRCVNTNQNKVSNCVYKYRNGN